MADIFVSNTVAAPDTTPVAFTFVDQAGVALSSMITSAPVVIIGIDAFAPVTITGGEYSIGCTASYTAVAFRVMGGETICVRHTSALANSTTVSTTLTVGGVSDTFTSTTEAGSGGGGGGSVDLFLLGLLGGLPVWRARGGKGRQRR